MKPNSANQVSPAAGARPAFHAIGAQEFPAHVIVDLNGDIIAPPRAIAIRASGNVTAPANGAVIADSGQMAAGDYVVEYSIAAMDTAAVAKGLVLEHRNAANNATIATLSGCAAPDSARGEIRRVTLAVNERVRVITNAASTAASKYQACVTLYPMA